MLNSCDTIMVGVCPTCRTTVQRINPECAAPEPGHEVRDDGGGPYWCRPMPVVATPAQSEAVGRCRHCREFVAMSEINALGYHLGVGINRFTGEDESPWCGPVDPPERTP